MSHNHKPFNIQEAKEGKRVITEDGRNVRIICFDALMGETEASARKYPIIGLVFNPKSYGDRELLMPYSIEGIAPSGGNEINLCMA